MWIFLGTCGWFLMFAGFGALVWELRELLDTGTFQLSSWGQLWYTLDPSSLNLYQATVERYVSAGLWDRVLAPMLFWDAVLVFAIPGLVLAMLHRITDGLFGKPDRAHA